MFTTIHLLNTTLNNTYEHTLYFSTQTQQYNYFYSKIRKTYDNYSYQRKDNSIRISEHFDTLISSNVNYVMYQNANYGNRWMYAFIKDIKYINDGTTELIIETDVIQTWMFNYSVGKCFVEREHVNDDTIGLHTYPENLESGEFVCYGVSEDEKLKDYCYVMLVTEWYKEDEDGNTKRLTTNFGGIPSAGGAYVLTAMGDITSIVTKYDELGKGDAITGIYMLPKSMIKTEDGKAEYYGQSQPSEHEHSILKPTSFNSFTPRNNKVLCYPYTYLLVSNNSGSSNIYQYEHFKSGEEDNGTTLSFKIVGVPSIGGSIKAIPKYYKGIMNNEEEGIMCGKYPTLSWSQDLYTNWMTQNAVNNAIGIGSGVAQIVGGIGVTIGSAGVGTFAGGGMILSGINQITGTLTQIHQHSFTPNSAKGNVNGGDINTASKNNTLFFYKMGVKEEYAQIIDNYFTMYGYKVCVCKTPNSNHRKNFWFTKTISANITGGIPNDDLTKIINCYNNGITFWKNPDNFRNYDVDNSIT